MLKHQTLLYIPENLPQKGSVALFRAVIDQAFKDATMLETPKPCPKRRRSLGKNRKSEEGLRKNIKESALSWLRYTITSHPSSLHYKYFELLCTLAEVDCGAVKQEARRILNNKLIGKYKSKLFS